MAEVSWPSAAPATITEHDHERLWSAFYQSGLVGDPSLSSLIFADSTGLQVKARADRLAQVRGFAWSSGTTDVTFPIAANASGSTRIDRIVLELDRSVWTVRLAAVEGTPGAGAPAVTQDPGPAGVWQHEVANITVVNGAATINAGNVETRNTYLGPPLLVADNGDLKNDPLPRVFLRYMPDDDHLQLNTNQGSNAGRRTLWLDSGEVTLSGSGTFWLASTEAVIQKINQTVHLRYGTVERRVSNLGANVDSAIPGIVPASMRHPTRDQYATARVSSGSSAGRVVVNRANHPTAPGRIEIDTHPGFNIGDILTGFTLTWLVP